MVGTIFIIIVIIKMFNDYFISSGYIILILCVLMFSGTIFRALNFINKNT